MKASHCSVLLIFGSLVSCTAITPVVEIEEDVYSYTNANNGAGPMWCSGSTCLVRVGDRIFVTGLETVPDAKPLNNCRWMLFERLAGGWKLVRVDPDGGTREPAPMAAFADGRVFLSVNPTLGQGPEPNGGPARPDVLQLKTADPALSPEGLAAGEEVGRAVRAALEELKPKYRSVLYLFYFRGLPVGRIAAELGVAPRRVSEWKDYGLKVIRARCGKGLGGFR